MITYIAVLHTFEVTGNCNYLNSKINLNVPSSKRTLFVIKRRINAVQGYSSLFFCEENTEWTKSLCAEFLHIRPGIQGGSNMTGINCDLFTDKSSWSYLNHHVHKVSNGFEGFILYKT
jgi:hypothetical protein